MRILQCQYKEGRQTMGDLSGLSSKFRALWNSASKGRNSPMVLCFLWIFP